MPGLVTPLTLLAHQDLPENPSKTGEFNLSGPLDVERHAPLSKLLLRWVHQRSELPLWDLDYHQLRLALNSAMVALDAKHMGITLQSLRHGGPSHDRFIRARSLLDIQARGSWRSFSSVLRYEKAALIRRQMQRLKPRSRMQVLKLAEQFQKDSTLLFEPLFVEPAHKKAFSTCLVGLAV